jgi:hypothetical protein
MIDKALLLLQGELAAYFLSKGDPANIVIDNIGLFETTAGSALTDNVILSLVNIEEETALKNQSVVKRYGVQPAVYENNPVYLNLYVLFTCNYSGEYYIAALRRLSLIIQFLQGKTAFSYASSDAAAAVASDPATAAVDLLELKFTMELYTLTFEQINHLWGSLGGRQMPSAMYKLRLVGITERRNVRTVPVVEEINMAIAKTN